MIDTRVLCDICGKNCSDKYAKLILPYYLKINEGFVGDIFVKNKNIEIGEKDVCPNCVKTLCNYLNIVVNKK